MLLLGPSLTGNFEKMRLTITSSGGPGVIDCYLFVPRPPPVGGIGDGPLGLPRQEALWTMSGSSGVGDGTSYDRDKGRDSGLGSRI